MGYLVKWMDLTYAESTWEDEDEDIPDLLNYIRDYEDLWYVCGADGRSKKKKKKGSEEEPRRKYNPPPDKPVSDLDVKYKNNDMCKWMPDGLSLHPYQLEGINWARQFAIWAPDFYVVSYVGDKDS